MKRIIIVILFVLILIFISCIYIVGESDSIQMKGEVITFTLYEDSSNMNIEFEFLSFMNNDQRKKLAFPVDEYLSYSELTGWVEHPTTENFVSIMDGDELPYEKDYHSYIHPINSERYIAYWYIYINDFPSHAIQKTSVNYDIPTTIPDKYADKSPFNEYDRMGVYIIHTGKTWKDAIENQKIVINNTDFTKIKDIMVYMNGETFYIDSPSWDYTFEDVEPTEDIYVFYNLES